MFNAFRFLVHLVGEPKKETNEIFTLQNRNICKQETGNR